ncbi:hypothetical protein [Microbacterium oxydans]|jgi:hypothetical protein|uniref:hypothetical protein n=1 Tax=Microbacterium oxydans TaxID=82380 RepID=UPI00226BA149|nr:hypothetical protein [Microbacterium oxydans]WAA64599.1 hypothetical protein MME74_10070 [Microbacterium oxydans]
MDEGLGVIVSVGVLLLLAAAVILLIAFGFSRMPIEKKYESGGGGLGGAFEAVWSPTAHEAGIERDRQTQRTAPAPSPGDPPDTIDDGRIRLDV